MATHFAQGNRQPEQHHQLGGKGLGGGHADFYAGTGVKHQFALARQGRFHHVAHRQAVLLPQRLRVFQGFHGIQRFAGLGYGNHQLVGAGNHVAVAVFAGNFHIGRHSADGFQPVFGSERGVVGSAASQDFDAADVFEHFPRFGTEVFRLEAAAEEYFCSIGNRLGLLVNFLLHEVAVRSQLQRGERQLGHAHFAFGLLPAAVDEAADTFAAQFGNVAVLQIHDAAREGHHGRNI